jgi:hypothetical protein
MVYCIEEKQRKASAIWPENQLRIVWHKLPMSTLNTATDQTMFVTQLNMQFLLYNLQVIMVKRKALPILIWLVGVGHKVQFGLVVQRKLLFF